MLDNFRKHAREFMRAMRNHHWEKTEGGVLVRLDSHSKFEMYGTLGVSRNFGAFDENHNLIPSASRTYGLLAMLLAGTQYSTWYFIPFATNTAPPDNLTSGNFNSTMTEFTNYSETTRQQWNAVNSGSVVNNAASLATITIANGVQTAVYGAGVSSAQAKSANTGQLFSCALAGTAKTSLELGETLTFSYGVTAASS